jgi:hypothetical protein
MLNRTLSTALFCLFILFAISCGGGTNILNVQSPYTTASSNASLERVQRTIITASAIKGWRPEHILATRRREGHVAKVDITYTSSSFNIRYVDSDNMAYNGQSISSVYTQWITELRDEIKRRLSRL